MTDVSALVGPTLGGQVVNLAHLVLLSKQMHEGNRLRHFSTSLPPPAPHTPSFEALTPQVDAVVNYIDGTFAASYPSIRQRYHGDDAARMLRAPLMLLVEGASDFAACFIDALCSFSPRVKYDTIDATRQYPLLLFSDVDQFSASLLMHAEATVPPPLRTLPDAPAPKKIIYLSAAEKLTLLLLLTQTKAVRDELVAEARRPLQRGEGPGLNWLDTDATILTSVRVQLLPFTRWLAVDSTSPGAVLPGCNDRAYLPLSEDNNAVTQPFGRVFDALLPIEIVHLSVHRAAVRFANVPSHSKLNGPLIEMKHINHVVMTICFMFYRFAGWAVQEAQEARHSQFRLTWSFPQFLRFVIGSVLSSEDWERALPPELHPAKQVLSELKVLVDTGVLEMEPHSKVYQFYRNRAWRGRGMSRDRLLIGILQIANVLYERDKKSDEFDAEQLVWQHTPLLLLNAKMMRNMAPHAVPTPSSFPDCGVLICDANAAFMKMMIDPLLVDLRFIPPNTPEKNYDRFRFDVHFADVTHPIETRAEVWCLASMKDNATLRTLKTYMHAFAMLSESPVPMDAQAILSFMAAIVNAGPDLFHWLNAFRVVINEWKQQPQPSQQLPKLDMDLDSSSDDDDDNDNFAVDARVAFLRSEDVMKRVIICCDRNFVPALLRVAVAEQKFVDEELVDSSVVEYFLSQVPWLLSSHIALTRKGFYRIVRLCPGFHDAFLASPQCAHWTAQRKQKVEEQVEDVIDTVHERGENFFDDPPYLCRDDSPPPPGSSSSSGSSEEEDALPARIKLDDRLLYLILESAKNDIEGNPQKRINALRKIAQLKAMTRLPRQRITESMPMLFRNSSLKGLRIDSTTCHIETLNLQTPLAMARVQPHAEKIGSLRAMATYFGAELVDASPECLSALVEQRLFIKGRTAAEILRPLNQQRSIFGGELPSMAAALVKQLLDAKGQAGTDIVQPLLTSAKALNCRKPIEPPAKKQNTGASAAQSSSSSSSSSKASAAAAPAAVPPSMTQIASAASAASAVPPHEYSPAAEQRYEAQYSPSHPGWEDTEPGVSPSGMSQFQQDECMQMMNTQDTEPDDFLRARQSSSSSGSKRKH